MQKINTFKTMEEALFHIIDNEKTGNIVLLDLMRDYLPLIYQNTMREIIALYTSIARERKHCFSVVPADTITAEKRQIFYHNFKSIIATAGDPNKINQLAKMVANRQYRLLAHKIDMAIIIAAVHIENGIA